MNPCTLHAVMPALKQTVPRSKAARFNEIVNILIRNDFWGLLRTMMTGKGERAGQDPAPVRLRRTLEELGPSFIKIGQLLATRPDLVPAPYVEELKKLYDKTTPSTHPAIREVLRAELGRDPGEVFLSFEPTALASASVGQVHRARLRDGTDVAVKIQHPGIEEAMLLDFRILRGLVTFIEKTFAASRVWQPTDHLDEVRAMLGRELDYRYEMRNTQRIRDDFRHDPTVHIPKMFDEHCTKRVLVMEFVDGIKFSRVDAPSMRGIDRKNVARIVTHAMAKQIFVHRLFHADPSPGNLLVLASNKVAFLDFGAVGIVTERRTKAILNLITSIAKGDTEATAEAVVDLCEQRGEYDPKRFANDIERIVDFFEREEVSVADPRMIEMIVSLAKGHNMLLPPDFMLITRALFQFDGFCRELDPDYELVAVLEPVVGEMMWKNLSSPKMQKELLEDTLGEMLRFGRTFPHALNRLVRRVERNELSTRIEVAGLEGLKRSQGRSALKLSFTGIMAALIVGLGIVYASPGPETRVAPFLFAAGAVVIAWAIVLVLWSESFKGNRE